MTMPSSGLLNMGGTSSPVSVAQELGLGLTSTISMNQANVRTLAGVGGSGATWSMSSLYGKSNITLAFNSADIFQNDVSSFSFALAEFDFAANGTITPQYTNTPYTLTGPTAYLSPAPTTGAGANYEISITVTIAPEAGGTLSFNGSAIGVGTTAYVSLASTRVLSLSSSIKNAYYTASGSVTIRKVGGSPLITRSFSLSVDVQDT